MYKTIIDIGISITTDRESAYTRTLVKTEYEKNVFGFYTEQRSRTVYTYGLGLAGERRDGGEEYYYHYNHIGSTMAVSDGGGNVIYRFAYDTYGELSDIATDDGVSLKTTERPDTHGTMKEADAAGIPETAAQYTLAQLAHATGIDYLYNGQYGVMTDQNGLYYMRARYYDQDTKRFINRDVVSGSISNSQSLNRYSYVQGNPVSLTDPFELCPDPNSNFKNFCVVLYNADWNAIGHGTLDVLGLFWEGFDVANALWYASEGKTEEAIACAVSALPGVGMIAGGLLAKTSKFKNAGKAVKYASRMTQGAIGTVAGAQITYTGLTNIINGIESGTLSGGDVLTFLGGIAITTLSGKNMVSSGRALQGVFGDVGKVSKAGKGKIAGGESGRGTQFGIKGEVIRTSSAEEVNAIFKDTMGYEPPYKPGTMVTEIVLTEKTTFVRVYDKVNSRMQGGWVMKAEDIAGLSPQEIQNKFALPNTPQYICDVNLEVGTRLRTGEVNPLFGFEGGGQQYDLIVNGKNVGTFTNERRIGH